jgi:hypothetical protein
VTSPLGFDESRDGISSPAGQEEWQTFLKMRDESVNQMLARQGITSGTEDVLDQMMGQMLPNRLGWLQPEIAQANEELLGHTNPLDYVPRGLQDRAAAGLPQVLQPTDPHADLMGNDHQALVDRAKVWGIPGADTMPTEMLRSLVAARRDDAVRPTDIGMMGWLSGATKLLGTGAGEALGGMVKDIPYIGESMNKMVHSQAAGQWIDAMKKAGGPLGTAGLLMSGAALDPSAMRQQNEQIMAGLPSQYALDKSIPIPGFLGGNESPAEFLSNVGYGVGYSAPSIAAWETVGALKGAGLIASASKTLGPIARAALGLTEATAHGGLAQFLARGGDDPAQQTREILGGAVGGFGGQLLAEAMPGMKALFNKVTDAFGTPITEFVPNVASDVSNADWYFDEGQGRLASPRQQLPAPEASPVRASDASDLGGVLTGSEGENVQPSTGGAIVRYEGNVGRDGPLYDVPPNAPSAPPTVRALSGRIGPVDDILDYPHAPFRPVRSVPSNAAFLAGSHVADAYGNPVKVFHGTDVGFDEHNISGSNPLSLWGDGAYYTEDPHPAGGTGAMDQPLGVGIPSGGYSTKGGPGIGAQVRPAYLDIKNPFRLDNLVADMPEAQMPEGYTDTEEAGMKFIDRFGAANPGIDVQPAKEAYWSFEQAAQAQGQNITLEHLHRALQSATYSIQGPRLTNVDNNSPFGPISFADNALGADSPIGRNGVNDGLKAMGYDGLTHVGGAQTGYAPHRVWIAWNATQVHPIYAPYVAAEHGIELTKQAEIMQSPLAAELANQAVLSNIDVARAMVASRSGGVNVVAGIGNLGETVRDMAMSGNAPKYRFVSHPSGRTDMLASDVEIPQDIVDEYSKHGMFSGQEVVTATGKSGKIMKFVGNKVMVKNQFATRGYVYDKANVYPKSGSYAYLEAPQAYDAFRQYAARYTEGEAAKAGLAAPGSLDPQFTTMLNDVMHNWFAHMGYDNPTQAGLEQYFNVRRMEDFKAVAPAEVEHAEQIQHQADVAEQEALVKRPPDIAQRAEANGFTWVNSPMTAGGQLWDLHSSLKFWMDSEGEADEFMKNYSREVPDHTPLGDLPSEVAPHIAQGSMLPPTGRVEDVISALDNPRGAPHVWDSIAEDAEDAANANDAADEQHRADLRRSGFGGPPAPPTPPPFAYGESMPGFEGDGPARLKPVTKYDFTDAFKQVSARDLNNLLEKHMGVLSRAILPTRTEMQRWSDHLYDLGLAQKGVDPWSKYEEVEAGFKQMEAFIKPHWQDVNEIFSNVRSKFLTDGTFSKVHEIQNYGDRSRAMAAAGFTDKERKASEAFRDWTDRMWDEGKDLGIWSHGRGFIPQYISHVRMRAGMPGVVDPWADVSRDLPDGFNFFADNMRFGGIEARQMDPRWLAQHYLRAMGWKAYVDAPMSDFTAMAKALGGDQYSTGPAPQLGQYMANWAKIAQRGYDLSADYAVSGLKAIINTVPGVHLTDQQTAKLLNQGLTNMHWAMLGFRPHVLFRDAIQPLLAGMKGSYTELGAAYAKYLNPTLREEMRQRAIDGGWAEVGRAPVEMPGMFDQQPITPSGEKLLSDKEQYVHSMLGAIGGWVRDMTPTSLRAIAGTKLDPLYLYQKEGGFNRIMAGEVGYQLAAKVGNRMNSWNRVAAGLGSTQDKELIADMINPETGMLKPFTKERFLSESHLDGFRRSVGEKAWALASSGDFGEAANLAGREMASETQFQYGTRNLAPAAQSLAGRMVMQFGTYSTNFASTLYNGVSRGSLGTRLKFLVGLAALGAGLKKASDETGFNFNNYAWVKAFGWMGGPIVQGMAQIAPGWAALVNAGTGGETAAQDQKAATAVKSVLGIPESAVGFLAKSQNPTQGLFATAGALLHAADQPNPLYEAAGVVLTGPSALGASYRTMEQQMMDNASHWGQPQLPPELEQHMPAPKGAGAMQ